MMHLFYHRKWAASLCLLICIFLPLAILSPSYFADTINRAGMNGILVLAMVPSIVCGTGLNFGLSIGILCGLLGGVLAVESRLLGVPAFLLATISAFLISLPAGYVYGRLLNTMKGDEMTAGTYIGFCAVSLMSVAWLLLPFQNPLVLWPMGGTGLRASISLETSFGGLLNRHLPLHFFLFLFLCAAFAAWSMTKSGIAMKNAGRKPKYAAACGICVEKQRLLGTMLSTTAAALGILVYASGYGFLQLYQAPLLMPFSAVAAILIGGAKIKRASVMNAIAGVLLYQLLVTVSTPFMNYILPGSDSSDAVRMVVSYGIILFCLTRKAVKK